MNKNLFRIIFNKRRGQLMAVAEISSSQGKGSRGESSTSASSVIEDGAEVALGVLSFAVLCALGAVLWVLPTSQAHAQVVAYRNAPGNQQPTVLQTANGVPQINIQTPSAAGVSRNVYSQFDVLRDGAVLNNSRTNAQTQLGGWVQGNPWLATGSARVILNEVNSSNPSYLNGYVEVAGQKAEVVIANPSGISVNGAGFINTSKATLTTGAPIVNNGSLDGYRVQAGNITINGNGLDLTSTDYAAILARAVQVNAGIWANELKVVTGANQIDASSLATNTTPVTAPIAGTGTVPSFALDVAQIGGMYAGKIHLIGTEQGLGVRSAGSIGSTGGDLVLENNGWLTTTGTLQASTDLQITTQDNITNSGTLYASNDQTLNATGHVSNSGLIAAQGNTTITASSLSSNGASVVGAGVKVDGNLTSHGHLSITTSQALMANGQNLAAGNITLSGSSVDLSASQTGAANIAINATSGNVNTSHATVAASGSSGVLAISAQSNSDQTLDNTHGVLSAGQLNFNVANLNNTQGQITQTGVGDTSIVLTAPTSAFNNTEGTVTVNSANLSITANTLNNTDGKVQHAGTGTLRVTAGTFDNVRGQAVSNNNVGLTVATQLDNTRGLLEATAGNLSLNVASLNNAQGSVYAAGDMSLVATGAITNSGFIAAQGHATLSANSLSSSSSSVLGAGIKANGSLANSGDLKITTTQTLSAVGQNLAAGNTSLSGSSVDLSGSQTGATRIAITATAGDVNTTHATVAATDTLNITAKANHNQTLNNTQGVLSAGQLNLEVANLNNSQGQLIQTGTGDTTLALTSPTSTFNNTNGTLATNSANLSLSANTLNNTDGSIQHAGTGKLALSAETFSNVRGQLISNQNASLQLVHLDNTQGSVYASGNLDITATGAMTNTGFIAAQGHTTLTANNLNSNAASVLGAGIKSDGTLANSGDLKITTTQGLVASGQNLAAGNITLSGSSVNLSGSQTSAARMGITATAGDLNASNATIAATNGSLSLVSQALDNTDGQLQATGNLTVTADALTNLRGQIVSNHDMDMQLASLNNAQGSVYAAGDMSLVATGAITNSGFIAAQGHATLSANSLSSSSSSVLGAGIKANGSLANSGDLKITTTQTLSAVGQNLAAGNTSLSGSSVDLSGSQTGATRIAITATAGDVNITHATVVATDTLNITAKANHNQTLNNTLGVVSAGQLNLDVANLNNSQGQLTQTGTGDTTLALTSPTSTFNNTNGTLATNSANLSLSANTLDNTDGKIQHAGTGTLHVTAHTLNDQHGQLVSNNALVIDAGVMDHRTASTVAKNITLTAASLNNNQGQLVQTGNGAMAVCVTQGLDNTAGTLASNGNLTVAAQALTNHQGQVSALGDLTLDLNTTTGALSNLQGVVASKGSVSVTAASVDNTLGTLASVEKNLSITTTGVTNNDSGKIQADLDITLANAGLSNIRTTNALATGTTPYGSIIGRNLDINTNTQTLNNAGGTIVASQSASFQTGTFNNNAGLIQTGKDLAINTHDQALNNTNAANYTSSTTALNGKGGIAAQGTTTLTTGYLNNDAGYIGSKGALTASSANISNTLNGQIQGLDNLTLSAGNAIATGTINNTGGLIRSAAITSLSAETVTNSHTSGADLGIEGSDVYVSATTLRNDSGAIRADHNITITSAGTVNNSAGLLSAGNTLTLQDVQAQSSRTLAITNANATLLAGQSLAVAAKSIGGNGRILSKGNINLVLNADFANSGEVIANGNATLRTSGNVTNSGKLQAGYTLNLTANNIDNTVDGEISANITQVNANSTLTNRGLIDGVDTQINANTVRNIGTGRIYGDHLSIAAVNLTNDTETLAGQTQAGTIAARDRLDLGVSGTLTNREHALIYSVGDMAIGGGLDATHRANGLATEVNNDSATIEAGRDLSLKSLYLNNINKHFKTEIVQVSGPVDLLYIQPSGTTEKILVENFVWQNWSRAGQYRYKTTPPVNDSGVLGISPVPRVGEQTCTGDEPNEVCTRLVGADYPRTDPAWTYFNITPPEIEPTQPNLAVPIAPDVTGASACQVGAGYNASACANYNNALEQYNISKNVYDTAWSNYSSAFATWQTETDALYTALDDKIDLYNETFANKVIRTWTQYAVTNTQSESQVVSSDPSQILSGRNMTLKGTNLTNDKSRIVSGGVLDGDLVNLNNIQGEGVHITHEEGTSKYTTTKWHGGFKRYHGREWAKSVAYEPADKVKSISLAVTEVLQNTTADGSGARVSALNKLAVNADISSAGGTSVRADRVEQNRVTTEEKTDSQIDAVSGSGGLSRVSAMPSQATPVNRISTTSIDNPTAINGTGTPSSTASTPATSTPMVVRTINANTTLPNSSLYKTNPSTTTGYLVETDTRFTNNKTWLGSDYMTQALNLDPTVTQKRLGDGFYEQKLIREQVAQLTGRRYLGNYTSDEQEYQALMNNAITYAQTYHLRPGIALTAQQVAQLTSDIVWLVEQTVTLPDGSTQKVLVPQLYVKTQPGDLDGSGTLLAGQDVNLNLSGDLTNSGTIAGRNVVNLSADNINNLGGRISGDDVQVAALLDINNVGGSINAISSLGATAGRDLNVQTTTRSGSNQVGASSFSRTGIDRVAGLYVSGANGTLVASAGRDLNIVAGVVSNAGSGTTSLSAGNNLNLNTVTTHVQENSVRDARNFFKYGTTQEVGSQVTGGGSVSLNAGNDINARAANVQATGALSVNATGSVNITAGQASSNYDEAHQQISKGLLSGSTKITRDTSSSTTALASNLGGRTVSLNAGKDIAIKGSNVVSDNGTTLAAANNISIEAAQNTSTSSSFNQTRKSGFSISSIGANPIGVSYSKTKQSDENQSTSTTAAASTVGSLGGNVSIQAGQQYKQVGSDVLTPTGDISITAKKVDIVEARETNKQSTEQKFEQSGISVGLKGGIIDSVQATTQAVQAAKDSSNNRNRNLNALIAYGKGADAYEQGKAVAGAYDKNGVMGGTDAAGNAQPGAAAASGIKVSISLGSSKSQSNSTTTSNTSVGSTVKAGGNVNIKATGTGEGEGNLTVQGSNVSAAKEVSLSATQDVNILASADTESNRSSSKSSSTSVGVSVGIGSGGAGLSLDIAASRGKGQANSDSTTYNNSHITGGNAVNITSGGDTTLKGGNVSAQQVTANVGGNLNVESLQDTATSQASQKTTGIALSIPIVGAGGSASFSQSKQNSNSNYASVNEQSGIKAGEGGFAINVGGNTDLKGATIVGSTDASKNTLTTNTLTTSDISNSMSASASSSGVSVGTNMLDGKYAMAKGVAGNLLNNGSASQSDASTTTSAISAGGITIGSKATDTSKDSMTDSNGKAVSTDTTNTNRTLAKADVSALQKSAQEQQAANMLVLNAATALADPAFKAAFLDQAKMYKKIEGVDDNGKPTIQWQEMTPEEKAKIPPGSRVANNGIFNGGPNDPKAAQDLANQNSSGDAQFLIHFPQANNMISELLVAGYQKFLEGGTLGLTNATQQNVDLWNQTGGNVTLDGHSRGGMTVGNALTAVQEQGGKGGTTNVNLFGSAYNAQDAANTVNQITDGAGQVKQSTNNYDFIGRILGGNAGTGGTIPEGSSVLEEVIRTMGGNSTVHNNYGDGKDKKGLDDYWGGTKPTLQPVKPINVLPAIPTGDGK